MKHAVAVLATGLALLGTAAHAAVTFDYIFDGGFPIAVSDDGSVIAGHLDDGSFTPFRWTQATGVLTLGRALGPGGLTGISADGTRIAESIRSIDNTYSTQGLWTLGSGWQELMPPMPPDGGVTDGSYGSIWGLSGDGTTPVGLYWRSGFGRAHASKWTQATGVVDLGGTATNQASRANGASYDASVIVGWVETPTGPWRPAAWDNGSLVLLTDYYEAGGIPVGSGEARATSPSGDIVVGFSRDEASDQRAAAMWKRTDGVFGPTEILGWVDGTEPAYGINIAYDVDAGGTIVVGYCSFDGSPFNTKGFVWTASTGVVDVQQWLAGQGVLVDPNFTITSMFTVTPDGTQLFGSGTMLVPPYTRKAFKITRPPNQVAVATPGHKAGLELRAPSPNPSSSVTRLDFTLTSASSVDLSIYDTSGRKVSTLLHDNVPAGQRSVTWDGRGADGRPASAGLYYARLATPEGFRSRPIVRVR